MKDRNLIIGVIGILVGIFGVAVSILSIRSSVDIAERSGSFEKGELVARIARQDVGTKREPINIIFGIDFNEVNSNLVIGHFPLAILNSGKKSINNITVTYQYHESFSRHAFEHLSFEAEGTYEVKELDRSFSKMGSQHYASYRLRHLAPGMSFGLNDPIALHKTEVTEKIPLEGSAYLPVTLKFWRFFDILITAQDLPRLKQDIHFQVIDAKSKDDLIARFKKDIAYDEADKLRNESTFIEYLGYMLFNKHPKSVILVYPELRKVEVGEIVMYDSFVTDENITTASYELASIDFLMK
ncbi:MAG: hypothetical protein AB2727_03960 [Candidatus Thiodiazotropha taylori]